MKGVVLRRGGVSFFFFGFLFRFFHLENGWLGLWFSFFKKKKRKESFFFFVHQRTGRCIASASLRNIFQHTHTQKKGNWGTIKSSANDTLSLSLLLTPSPFSSVCSFARYRCHPQFRMFFNFGFFLTFGFFFCWTDAGHGNSNRLMYRVLPSFFFMGVGGGG